MTFDEEVYEYAKSRNGTEDSRMTDRMLAYRAGAESKEKQIQIDTEQIRALQKQNGELTDELTLTNNECKEMREELKQRIRENQKLCEQVEKMKSDVLSLIKDRMNDDIDQNIIERLAEKWERKEK